MLLKKIEIHGFKSFADKIELNVQPGITAVVGPNGSGKSNISDGVRWVLGEQSVKTLRGSKMEDVIFAGSSTRKPQGFAEVSITLDNVSGALPIDYSEVTITRRVYRSGDSEFYINKSNCRLKDITELLMDTGIGRDGYSIIGQGRIDEILSTKSEDRRQVFEEAAGIVKFKNRKQESEKKLEQTEQNLLRINDIIGEIEKQLVPLDTQSEKAKLFIQYRDKLKQLDINIMTSNLEVIQEKLNTLISEIETCKSQVTQREGNLEGLDKEISDLKNVIDKIDEDIVSNQRDIFNIENNIEKSKGNIRLYEEKRANAILNINRIKDDQQECLNKVKELDAYLQSLKEERVVIIKKKEELEKQLKEREEYFRELDNNVSLVNLDIEDKKGDVIEILNQISDKKGKINSIQGISNNIFQRLSQINREKDIINQDIINTEENLNIYKKKLSDKQLEQQGIKSRVAELEASRADLSKQEIEAKSILINKEKGINSLQSRLNVLEDMEKDYEGYSKSVKSIVLESQKNSSFKGIVGAVAQLIKVSKEYETAIEIALGGNLQNIITEGEEDAKLAIDYLKAKNLGRATFLPISTVKGYSLSGQDYETCSKSQGFINVASNLMEFDSKYKGIFSHLLDRVIVVDKIENGFVISKKLGQRYRIVSLAGDIITPGGAITGGSTNQKSFSILSRAREIEELKLTIEEDTKKYQAALQHSSIIITKITEINKLHQQLGQKLQDIKIDEVSILSEIKQREDDIVKANTRKSQLLDEEMILNKQHQETRYDYENLTVSLQEMEALQASLQNEISGQQRAIKNLLEDRDKVSNEVITFKIELATLNEKIVASENLINITTKEIDDTTKLYNLKSQELAKNSDADLSIDEQMKGFDLEIISNQEIKGKKEEYLELVKEERKGEVDKLAKLENRSKNIMGSIRDLSDSLHKMEVQRTKLEIEEEGVHNRLWEEYSITLKTALEIRQPIENYNQALREINSLKTKIAELGDVNINAIEEYKDLKERYQFIKSQRDDLIQARESLARIITDIEENMEKQFVEQMKVINEKFGEVFKRLFGGGRAEIVISDPDNVLESGIEIIAQPPGKKLQNLSLLSGGERALTAISLLFGILLVKPSPFCILDEIEAALDDANVNRYGQFLKELSTSTQFIVVTHRKGTMEAADALYGVTMEDQGVSKLVSVKLTDKAS